MIWHTENGGRRGRENEIRWESNGHVRRMGFWEVVVVVVDVVMRKGPTSGIRESHTSSEFRVSAGEAGTTASSQNRFSLEPSGLIPLASNCRLTSLNT
jgi:hypothetical protein